ncbi:MAG: hypothetical protein RIB84_23980 [Sneathiellaceae bacterium]
MAWLVAYHIELGLIIAFVTAAAAVAGVWNSRHRRAKSGGGKGGSAEVRNSDGEAIGGKGGKGGGKFGQGGDGGDAKVDGGRGRAKGGDGGSSN